MGHLDIILPFFVLLLTFVLKLLIAEDFKPARAISSLCELPIDMIFLAISFLIAIVISDGKNRNDGLFYLFTFIVLAVITVFISKMSVKGFEAGVNKYWIWMFVGNLIVTVVCLRCSIVTLTIPETISEKKIPQTQSPVNNNPNGN